MPSHTQTKTRTCMRWEVRHQSNGALIRVTATWRCTTCVRPQSIKRSVIVGCSGLAARPGIDLLSLCAIALRTQSGAMSCNVERIRVLRVASGRS